MSMKWARLCCAVAFSMSGLLPVHTWAAPLKSIAVMDFEILDETRQFSAPEVVEAQHHRLKLISDELRREFAARQLYKVLDNSTAGELIDTLKARQELHDCNGCEMEIGTAMDADLILLGWVQKVSNLILNINVEVKNVHTGELVYNKSVDIRGNTDTTWLRGIKYMVDSIVERKQHLR